MSGGSDRSLPHGHSKKCQQAPPRVLRDLGVIVGPLIVEERVPRAWIDFLYTGRCETQWRFSFALNVGHPDDLADSLFARAGVPVGAQ